MDKQITLSRKATYVITAGVIIHLAGRILYFFMQYSPPVTTTGPIFLGIVLSLLTGAAVFRAAGYFHERTAKNIMHYVGIALILETASYAVGNLLAGIPSLMVAGAAEILVLYGCVAHLRQTAKEKTVYIAQQMIKNSPIGLPYLDWRLV